jgi:hypothetical protein
VEVYSFCREQPLCLITLKKNLFTTLLQSKFFCLCLKFYMLTTSCNKFENITSCRIFRQKNRIFGDHLKIMSRVVRYAVRVCNLWRFIQLSHYMNIKYDFLSGTLLHVDTYIRIHTYIYNTYIYNTYIHTYIYTYIQGNML